MFKKKKAEPPKEGTIKCACGDEVPVAKAVFVTPTGSPNPGGSCEACYQRSFREPAPSKPHPCYTHHSLGKHT